MFPTKDIIHMKIYTYIRGCNSHMNVKRPFQTRLYKAASIFTTL